MTDMINNISCTMHLPVKQLMPTCMQLTKEWGIWKATLVRDVLRQADTQSLNGKKRGRDIHCVYLGRVAFWLWAKFCVTEIRIWPFVSIIVYNLASRYLTRQKKSKHQYTLTVMLL